MPNIYSPCTWNMTSAQLVTPTNSQLAALNAIQAMIASSTYWTVNATGTVAATGYKWIEVKPTNQNSIYKDYRVVFYQRVNSSTNKDYYTSGSPFNSTAYLPVLFCPDGGANYCTFTPDNAETGNPVYVGTKYKAVSTTFTLWDGIGNAAWTAFWMYECDGAMWIWGRTSAVSYVLHAFGNLCAAANPNMVDYNSAAVEVGLPCLFTREGITAGQLTSIGSTANSFMFWRDIAGTKYNQRFQSANSFETGGAGALINNAPAVANYKSANWQSIFGSGAQTSPETFTPLVTLRGVFWGSWYATRTTIQKNGVTIGYSLYPDDSAVATASQLNLMFINVP